MKKAEYKELLIPTEENPTEFISLEKAHQLNCEVLCVSNGHGEIHKISEIALTDSCSYYALISKTPVKIRTNAILIEDVTTDMEISALFKDKKLGHIYFSSYNNQWIMVRTYSPEELPEIDNGTLESLLDTFNPDNTVFRVYNLS